MNQTVLDKLIKARMALLIEQPFFGALVMRLKFQETDAFPTLAVNSRTVFYNPAFIDTLTNPLIQAALAHEVFHCVLGHCGADSRGLSMDPGRWNKAADYVVNDMLKQAGMTIGDNWLWDAQYAGKTAEQIYSMLPPSPPSPPQGEKNALDECLALPEASSVQKMEQTQWKLAATQAAAAAKARGKLHASMDSFVESMNQNKVDWRDQLRRFVSEVSKDDYSYARLSKKMQAAGFYLPGLYSEGIGHVFVGSDESGSISPQIVAAFGAEINAIRQDMRPDKITLAHFAVEVAAVDEFDADTKFVMKRKANGGTDFRPVLAHADKMETPPACIIMLTDLEGPFPDVPPSVPVLWVCTEKHVAPFGTTLHIDL